MGSSLVVRPAAEDDEAAVAGLLRAAFQGREAAYPGAGEALALGPRRLMQTGSLLLVAVSPGGVVVGVVRWGHEEGAGWFDLLASGQPWAGARLVREAERSAQETGVRTMRCTIDAGDGALAGYLQRKGYQPVARSGGGLTLEKRLPLLTVREQRRSDAAAIAGLTGEDPWPFEQGARPGWFVLADGDRVAGVIAVRNGRGGEALLQPPVLNGEYRGRGLEVWMAERAALYAATNGMHTAALPLTSELERYRRAFEDRRWFVEGERYLKSLEGSEAGEREFGPLD